MNVNYTGGRRYSFVRTWPSGDQEIPRLLFEYERSLPRLPELATSPGNPWAMPIREEFQVSYDDM